MPLEPVTPSVRLVGWTHFAPPEDVPWSTDAEGGPALVEFAGRACYQSWHKPNPATATNAGYLRHILESGHFSVLEHGTATFYIAGVSRSFTHELIRHRHLSYSQMSQRFVAEGGQVVVPEVIADDPELNRIFTRSVAAAQDAYRELVEGLEKRLAEREGLTPTRRRKLVRQAARAVLPNATETRIVVTGNYRAWRHFVALRATAAADVEIREVAVEVLRQLQRHAPAVFGDFIITTLESGETVAVSPYNDVG